VLIIGGGIAGMQAALDLGDMGITVHLVEKNPSVGGKMAQLDKPSHQPGCTICLPLDVSPSKINLLLTAAGGFSGSVGQPLKQKAR
jgi:heterodisulfide reductase subunit A